MREVCGPEVADKVNQVWGLTEEGEVNSVWRDCGHDALWFGIGTSAHSILVQLHIFDAFLMEKGNLGLSRFYSRHLALRKWLRA